MCGYTGGEMGLERGKRWHMIWTLDAGRREKGGEDRRNRVGEEEMTGLRSAFSIGLGRSADGWTGWMDSGAKEGKRAMWA